MPETQPPSTKESAGGNIFRKKRNEKAKLLLAQILAEDLNLEVHPDDIRSIKRDPTRVFYFQGISGDLKLTDVTSGQVEELEVAVSQLSNQGRSIKALWNPMYERLGENHCENEKEPFYLLPIPCKTLESFASKIDSSLRETCDSFQQRNTQLQAQLDQALERLDETQARLAETQAGLNAAQAGLGAAQAELLALREQRNRAVAVLGLDWTGMGVQQ